MTFGLDYAVAIALILFGPLIVVATLRVGVAAEEVRPACLR